MNYFVNVYERGKTGEGNKEGNFFNYSIYSESSIQKLKYRILESLKEEWEIDIDLEISHSLEFDEIKDILESSIYENDLVYDYSLWIGDSYIDPNKCVDFYFKYNLEEEESSNTDSSFFGYGENAEDIVDLFDYMNQVTGELEIEIPNSSFRSLFKTLFIR
jgi:hypothetical protein